MMVLSAKNHESPVKFIRSSCFDVHLTGSYVNFVTISIWDETFGFILAMVVFFATLKFIKMLKFNKRMGMLGDTILLATAELKSFCLMFAIYYFAFAQCAFQLFGKVR